MSQESKSVAETNASVLVVGGGVAGLSAALFLAWRGVRTVLVERHPGSSAHPRALGFTTRTLELFRAVGLGPSIPEVPLGHGRPRRVAVESLAGRWSAEVPWTASLPAAASNAELPAPKDGYSACRGAAIAQDRLEPMLRNNAIELGADVRMSTTLLSFEQAANGVSAVLRRNGGSEYTLRADYMIAADGHASPIREALSIGRAGHGFMHVVRSVLFRADLDAYLEAGISQFELDQPGLKGMLTTYRDGRWLLMVTDDEERDELALKNLVIRALGRSDLDIAIITTGRWELSALIADRFSSGRIFIVGDAAHTLPPARGGYGANTGIEDSFNLAWKLAAVLSGASTTELLDTYDAERRPIAWLRHDQIFARQDYAAMATLQEKQVAVIEDEAMELGQLYRSSAVLGAADDLPPARRPEQWAGQPGTRAPHLWVSKADERLSTLDLLHRTWVLVTEDSRWRAATSQVSARLGLELPCLYVGAAADAADAIGAPPAGPATLTVDTPIERVVAVLAGKAVFDAHIPELTSHETYATFKSLSLRQLQPLSRGLITEESLARVAADLVSVHCAAPPTDPEAFRRDFRAAFGIGPAGACLIRPDGYVAWRSIEMCTDPVTALADAWQRTACARRRG